MIGATLRVVLADDEGPARKFLRNILESYEDVKVVGEAAGGQDAIRLIEAERPDLALLDLQMPEVGGFDVVRLLRRDALPLFAFVTAYDEHAVRAFEVNAIDYVLKPVEPARLRATLNRAQEHLERAEYHPAQAARTRTAAIVSELAPAATLRRIPVRADDDILLVPVEQIAALVANGAVLELVTLGGPRYTITYRLKDAEARLPSGAFVRLSRGVLVNVDQIQRVSPMPGGTYLVTLRNGLGFPVSRLQARVLRDQLFRL